MKGYVFYLVGSFINVLGYVVIKKAGLTSFMPIEEMIAIRGLFAMILSLPFNVKEIRSMKRPTLLYLFGFLTIMILSPAESVLLNKGLSQIPVSDGVFIIAMSPIVLSILSVLILKEKFSGSLIANILINTVCVFVIFKNKVDILNYGHMMILAAVLLYCANVIVMKSLLFKLYSAELVSFVRISGYLVLFLFLSRKMEISLQSALFGLFIATIFVAERYLITKSYMLSRAIDIQPFRYFNIIFSSALSYIILQEKIEINYIIAFIVIILSTFALQTNVLKHVVRI